MAHRYKVREIAQQSGLSEATVDRVLNQRPGVRENTRAEVLQAIADLDKQRAQLRLVGRRYLIDVVMQTPQRFSAAATAWCSRRRTNPRWSTPSTGSSTAECP
jgi:LacI family transcriptional regulator